MNVKEKLDIENEFKLIKESLIKLNIEEELIFNLISLCEDYQNLSISDLNKTDKLLEQVIYQINNDKNWNIQLKEELLSLLNRIKKNISKFTVNSIIESVQF